MSVICILISGLWRSAGDKSAEVIISAIGSDLFSFYCEHVLVGAELLKCDEMPESHKVLS